MEVLLCMMNCLRFLISVAIAACLALSLIHVVGTPFDIILKPARVENTYHLIKQQRQRQIHQEVATILLEFYHCEGPIHLLDAIKELYHVDLKWAIISHNRDTRMAFMNYGDVLFAEYEFRNDPQILETSIKWYQKAIHDCTRLDRPRAHVQLARALFHRFMNAGSEEECRTAVNMLEAIWQHTTHEVDRVSALTTLAFIRAYLSRNLTLTVFHTDTRALLHHLMSVPRSNLTRSQYTLLLLAEANLNNAMYNETFYQEYLEDGLRLARFAQRLISQNAHVLKHQSWTTLYTLHSMGWAHSKTLGNRRTHLTEAIHIGNAARSSVLSRYNEQVYREGIYLGAITSLTQSLQLEDLDNIERAVKSLRIAYSLVPPSHVTKAAWKHDLLIAMSYWFERSGHPDVFEEFVSLQNDGSDDTVPGLFWSSNVMEAMLSRVNTVKPLGSGLGLDWTSQLCQSPTPSLEPTQPQPLMAEADIMMIDVLHRQLKTENPPLFDDTTVLKMTYQNIVKAQTDPSTRIKIVLAQIDVIINAARRTRSMSQSLRLVDYILVKELSGYMNSTMYRADLLAAQADLMVLRADLQGKCEDGAHLCIAWKTYQRAATSTSGRAAQRFQACLRWASHAQNRGFAKDAWAAYSCAIEILPSVIFLGDNIQGRIDALSYTSGLAASSAAIALDVEDIGGAIDFLERTRGILWLQSFGFQTRDFDDLPAPMRSNLERITVGLQGALDVQWSVRRRQAAEYERVISSIRAMPGFERFMLPPLLGEILDALWQRASYAIVIIPSANRCDVLVLGTPGQPVHLHNATLDTERLLELSQRFDQACVTARRAENGRKFHQVPLRVEAEVVKDDTSMLLAYMWTSLVLPIIRHLKLPRQSNIRSLKRVWWCPIGPLSSLPLHAAGTFDGSMQDHVGNYMISSYTPTLSVLHRLLKAQGIEPNNSGSVVPRILLAAQPHTEGALSLPHAQEEVDVVRALVPTKCITNSREQTELTIDEGLQAAMVAHIFHLACHGHQDQEYPLNSGFDMRDGRLTIGDLMKISTPYAQLAYLSACESARMDVNRPDQILHLAATMMFIGFRSVIGTMWTMDDIDGPFMAKRIYGRIFRNGSVDISAVPYAVHEAMNELRESGVPASRWATYVHFGV